MNPKNLQINFSPTEKDLSEIEKWLIQEDKEHNEGFYCNWSIISGALKKNELIVLESDSQKIGFCVFADREIYVEIDILEIKRELRGKGIGKFFFNELEKRFKNQEFKVAKLTCSPIESESFWRKIGFKDLPPTGSYQEYLTLYKPLIEVQESTINSKEDRLELWNKEPNRAINYEPEWSWEIPKDNSNFEYPILHPCSPDWKLRLVRDGKTVKEDKVKYFSKQQILNRLFLYIEKLEKE